MRWAWLLAAAACGAHVSPPPLERGALATAWEEAPATGGGGVVEATWWRSFHDPVLERLVETAVARNLDVRIAAARVREARALRGGARAELWPEITGRGGVTTGRASPGADVTTRAEVGAELAWEIDLFGRLRRERRAAEADVEAAAADREAVRVAVIADVAEAYLEYRLQQQRRLVAEKNAESQADTVRIARARFAQGITSRLDVERTEALLPSTRAQVAEARELAAVARHRLVLLLATTPEAVGGQLPEEGSVPAADPMAVLLTPEQVIGRRPDVRAAERRLLAAAARRGAAEALRWPRLSLGGLIGLGVDDVGELSAGTPIFSFAANLLAPIFDFGRIRATIDAADARQEQAYLAYELVARTALQEVQTAIVLYTRGLERQRELTAAVEASRRAAELARRQYAVGTLSLLEVLDVDRVLYASELALVAVTAEVAQRVVRLYRTMGAGA